MTLALELHVPPASLLRSFDPRWKLLALILGLTVVLSLHALGPLLAALLFCLAVAQLGRLSWRWYRKRIVFLLPMLIGLVLFLPLVLRGEGPAWELFDSLTFSLHGLVVACRLALKALAALTLVLIVLGTTPLPTLFQAAHALRVPGFLIQLVSLTFRYALLMIEEFGRLRLALRVRGFRSRPNVHTYRVMGHVTGTLLVRGVERAERVGQAMRCRGFDGRYRSSTEFSASSMDVVLFLLFLTAMALLLLWDWSIRFGGLW